MSDDTSVDMTWDNIEDTAPTMEEGVSNESIDSDDDWDSISASSEDSEVSDESSDESASEADGAVETEPVEDREASKESAEDESESDSAQVEIPEAFKEMGLVSENGELGKMVKVDGEEVFVSLKDLGNDYSGQKAIAQRFNEYDRKEKEFNAQMNEVNDYINELGATMRDQSILGGVQKIGELVGMAPHQLKEALLNELLPEIERRYGLSDEELALEFQKSENEYLRQQTESNNYKLKAEQAQRELLARVEDLRETHNISRQEWQEYEATLANHYAKEEITPDLVVNYSNYKQAETRADSVINSFDSSYANDKEVMDALVEQIYDNPNLSDDDFREILETALGSSKKEAAEQKVEKAVEAKEKSKPKKKEDGALFAPMTDSSGQEILDWDDIL